MRTSSQGDGLPVMAGRSGWVHRGLPRVRVGRPHRSLRRPRITTRSREWVGEKDESRRLYDELLANPRLPTNIREQTALNRVL
jgi:hypothetical protein